MASASEMSAVLKSRKDKWTWYITCSYTRKSPVSSFSGGSSRWLAALRPGRSACARKQPGQTYRLGGLTPSSRDAPHYIALFDELRRLGFIEGQNLTVDWRGYGVRDEQFPDIAVELIKAKVDVIFCAGDVAVRAAQQATATIPILAVTDDMVGSELVRSMAQPGGNTTGVSILATELDGKRQDILIEAVPGLRRMAGACRSNRSTPKQLQALQDAARARGVELLIHLGCQVRRSRARNRRSEVFGCRGAERAVVAAPRCQSPGHHRSAPLRCACQRCTNGRKWPRRAVLSRTARASFKCFESLGAGSSSSSSAAQDRSICRSNSGRASSWST